MISALQIVCRTDVLSILTAVIWLAATPDLLASEQIGEKETRDMVELLISPYSLDVESGEKSLAAQRSTVIETLLSRVKTGDLQDKRRSVYLLGLVLSPWMRGKEMGERNYGAANFSAPRRPVNKKPNIAEGRAIRSVLQRTMARLLAEEFSDSKQVFLKEEALKALRETLVEVANDDTIDWAVDLLSRIESPEQTEFLIGLVDECLGIPEEYTQAVVCGNSTPEEFEFFAKSERSDAAGARKASAEKWSRIRAMDEKKRIAFALAKWQDRFTTWKLEDPDNDNALNDWYYLRMESLVRLGLPAVPALRALQAQEKTLRMKSMWELPIATITGQENQALVSELLKGDKVEAALACEIIVAAGSKRWLHELDALQKRKDFSRNRASDAIASCFGAEGIPALKRGLRADRKNYTAKYSLEELAQWAKRGAPKEMWRYEYLKLRN